MELKDLYVKIAPYIVLIQLIKTENGKNFLMGSSSGFLTGDGYLITNFHVMQDFLVGVSQGENLTLQTKAYNVINGKLSFNSWHRESDTIQKTITGYCSEEQANDYIILNIDIKVVSGNNQDYEQILDFSEDNKVYVGQRVCVFGYPFGKENLSMNQGIISSIYERCGVKVFQIDGIVNNGNSGGPLVDIETGKVIGIVSRKEDGLNELFKQLKKAIESNIKIAHQSSQCGGIIIGGINPTEAIEKTFITINELVSHIERSANVGIGYVFSVNKIIEDLNLLREEKNSTPHSK